MSRKSQEKKLSRREIQILKAVCNDLRSEEIAKKLKITVPTVNFHRANIYKKSKAKGLAGLVKFAIRNGFAKI